MVGWNWKRACKRFFGLLINRYTLQGLVCVYSVGYSFSNVFGYPAQIDGKSMDPALNDQNEWVFVNLWAYRKEPIQRGGIVTFVSHRDPANHVIKRVIGLEGDIVYNEKYEKSKAPVKIPSGHLWVEGDNFNVSRDSIKYGPINVGLVFGKATHILWPYGRWGSIRPTTKSEESLSGTRVVKQTYIRSART